MKKTFIVATFSTLCFLYSCEEKGLPTEIVPVNPSENTTRSESTLLILKVDYASDKFEGGVEFSFSPSKSTADSIPLVTEYAEPVDFDGYVKLRHIPTNKLVFDASVFWGASGKVSFPSQLNSRASFEAASSSLSAPSKSQMQLFCKHDGRYDSANFTEAFAKAWGAVCNLTIVNDYYVKKCKVGVLLYYATLGVPEAQPDAWYILLYN